MPNLKQNLICNKTAQSVDTVLSVLYFCVYYFHNRWPDTDLAYYVNISDIFVVLKVLAEGCWCQNSVWALNCLFNECDTHTHWLDIEIGNTFLFSDVESFGLCSQESRRTQLKINGGGLMPTMLLF